MHICFFLGCISHYHTGNVVHNLLREAEAYGISTCETCSANPCLHGGVCQEALTMVGYNCICPPGFSGRDCEIVGEACYPGVCGEGRCINKPGGGFDCYCPLGRTGIRCEKGIKLSILYFCFTVIKLLCKNIYMFLTSRRNQFC